MPSVKKPLKVASINLEIKPQNHKVHLRQGVTNVKVTAEKQTSEEDTKINLLRPRCLVAWSLWIQRLSLCFNCVCLSPCLIERGLTCSLTIDVVL